MPMMLASLDDVVRAHMLSEIASDVASGRLYLGERLSDVGKRDWPDLLRTAVQEHDEAWLARQLANNGRLNSHETRRNPKGGAPIVARLPYTANQTMAEGEFNRFYARGVCLCALETGRIHVLVYRAKAVDRPRPESEALINTHVGAAELLADLRNNVGVETALGVPAGPNSGLSVRLD